MSDNNLLSVYIYDASVASSFQACWWQANVATISEGRLSSSVIIIIIIIIKKRLAMQGCERAINTLSVRRPQPHQTNPQNEEEKGKRAGDKKWASSQANKKALALLLKPASPTPSNMGAIRSFHRDTGKGIKVRRYTARFCSEEAHKWTDVRSQRRLLPAPAHTAQGEHHKEGASGYT